MPWEVALARVLPGPILRLIQILRMRPYADPRIVDLYASGGSTGVVDFVAQVANYGTQQCRCSIIAAVAGTTVQCAPPLIDLIPNVPPQTVRVLVPRPQFGDLVPEFNHETTLYGETLRIDLDAGKRKTSREWREHVYTQEENRQRYAIQQRKWRFAKGTDTADDRRADHLAEHLREREE